MSGGYRKYLSNVIPRMATHHEVQALLCVFPGSLCVKDWFEPLSNVQFVDYQWFQFFRHSPDQELKQHLEKFSPDVIFVPTGRFFRFNEVPTVNMIRNMEPLLCPNEGNPVSEMLKNWLRARKLKRR